LLLAVENWLFDFGRPIFAVNIVKFIVATQSFSDEQDIF
jgi:hypothetical protein